jgi:hypothetical protein
MRDLENLDMLVPPATDAGTIPNLKFSFFDIGYITVVGRGSNGSRAADYKLSCGGERAFNAGWCP